MKINSRTIIMILLGLLAFYIVFVKSSFRSTFGGPAGAAAISYTVSPGATSVVIPIKDTSGNNLGSSGSGSGLGTAGVLTVALTVAQNSNNPAIVITAVTPGTPSGAVGARVLSAPTVTYTINGIAQPAVSLAPAPATIAASLSTKNTTCITPATRAAQGYVTDTDWANAHCKAAGFTRGSAGDVATLSPACAAGSTAYKCTPNEATITLTNTYTSGQNMPTPTITVYENASTTVYGSNLTPSITAGQSSTITIYDPGYIKMVINNTNYFYRYKIGASPLPTGVGSWTGDATSGTIALPSSTVNVSVATDVPGIQVGT